MSNEGIINELGELAYTLDAIGDELRRLRVLKEFELGLTVQGDPDDGDVLQLVVGRANEHRGKGVVIWDEIKGDLIDK